MGLFKNGIGRPSNEILKKRKIVSLVGMLIGIAVIISTILYFNGSHSNISGDEMNVITNTGYDDVENIIDPNDGEIEIEANDDDFYEMDGELDEWDE